MITSMSIAKSALDAYGVRQAVTANNVANMLTPDYTASSTVMTENRGGGVRAEVVTGSDTVDISQEAVDLIMTKNGYHANLKSISTADAMMKDALDLVK